MVTEFLGQQLAVDERRACLEVDLVLSDAPIPPFVSVRAQGRLLMETGVILMAAPALAENLRGSFPESCTRVAVVPAGPWWKSVLHLHAQYSSLVRGRLQSS